MERVDEMKDETLPTSSWKFDEAVTEVFDDMLERSIPDYAGMRRTTTELALRFAKEGTAIVDLGCSRGKALRPIIDALGDSNSYVGVEISKPMANAARKEIPEAKILELDLRDEYPTASASVTLAVLTLQFTPIEYRQRILEDAYSRTVSGGVILLVVKILGSTSYNDRLLVETYYGRKGENGYTAEQITAKRRSLEGVLVPVTAKWNEELLESAGFRNVECYWRHLNFAAWLGVKP